MGSAASYSDRHSYALFSLEVAHNHLACARSAGPGGETRNSRIGARDETTSSEFQLIAYACYARIPKPSPPTTYHGQGLAWGSHTGSYRSAMSKSKRNPIHYRAGFFAVTTLQRDSL